MLRFSAKKVWRSAFFYLFSKEFLGKEDKRRREEKATWCFTLQQQHQQQQQWHWRTLLCSCLIITKHRNPDDSGPGRPALVLVKNCNLPSFFFTRFLSSFLFWARARAGSGWNFNLRLCSKDRKEKRNLCIPFSFPAGDTLSNIMYNVWGDTPLWAEAQAHIPIQNLVYTSTSFQQKIFL